MNKHYATISTDSDFVAPQLKQTAASGEETFKEFQFFKYLDKLHITATGLDKLPVWFLRMGAPMCARPICNLFNTSLNKSIVPSQRKQALTKPIPKVKTPSTCSDFRPISITPVLSRVMLYIPDMLCNWLVNYFDGRSHCTHFENAISMLEEITASIIQGSSLGPAAYIVDAFDLKTVHPENKISKFADDTVLGVTLTDSFSMTEHVTKTISSYAQALYALRMLDSQGLNQASLQLLISAMILAKI